MKWIDKLERKFGKYAIRNLMNYITILYAVGFVINIVAPQLYPQLLSLDAEAILHGQIWRIVTFIIEPPTDSYIFILFSLYLYYMIGRTLEYQWGTFRFNLFYFSGMLLHVLVCILIFLVTGMNFSYGAFYLNLSMFFVYLTMYPDAQFLLFFIIPIRARTLAIIEGLYYGVTIIAGFFVPMGSALWFSLLKAGIFALPANSIAALVSLLNFFVFYYSTRRNTFSPKEVKRRRDYQKKVKVAERQSSHHRCAVCGRTEADGEELEFRFCSKCVGNYEYCQDHLFTHEHRK